MLSVSDTILTALGLACHAVCSKEGGMNAANLLKPMLARGELRLIGATTLDEYRQYIEKGMCMSLLHTW